MAGLRFPPGPVTNALAIINLVIATVLLVPAWWQQAVISGGLFPARFGAGSEAFQGLGFLLPAWITPLSAAFLHGGLVHVILNMLMLLLIGKMVERVLGAKMYLLLYVIGAYAAALAEWIGSPQSLTPVVGASGAISAVIGAYVLLFPNQPPKPWGPISAKIARPLHLLIAWIALNVMIGFVGPGLGISIAIWSHIGGFIAGLLLVRPMLLWRYRKA
ncbi:MAG: rhomboid family intramembrane serine protease [Sphingorhabdus sp.]